MVMSILWKLVVDSLEQSRFLVSLMSPVLCPCLTTVFSLDYSTLGYSHPASVERCGRVDATPMGLLHWLHSESPQRRRGGRTIPQKRHDPVHLFPSPSCAIMLISQTVR